MNKILLSLLTVALVSVVAVGATRAYFSDAETSTGNSFTAGTLVVNIDGTGSSTTPYFSVPNMAPGDTATSCFIVKNTGSLGMLFRAYFNPVSDPKNLASQLDVTVTIRPTAGCNVPSGFNAYGPANTVIWTGKLNLLESNSPAVLNNINAAFHSDGILNGNYAAPYLLTVHLPETTGNTYQGAAFSGNIQVDATQFANQVEASIQW